MNFDLTDEQQMIKSTARDFLSTRYTAQKVRELAESQSYDPGLWREVCDLGWPGLFISERYTGQGLGTVELVIVMEELGYAVAPMPFFSNAAAGLVIAAAGSEEQKQRLLPQIALGSSLATVAVASDGVAQLVPDAEQAELIVCVENGRAAVLDAGQAQIEPVAAIDGTRRFSTVRGLLPQDDQVLPGDPAQGIDQARAALAAELTGIAQRCIDMSVEYAKERHQFDRAIGSFQAVSHRLAQMLLETEGARSASYYAGWAADYEPDSLPLAAAMAKAYASDAGWRVATSALQVHGGIAFTWEHDLHFYLKRAAADARLFGSAREQRERVASLCGLQAKAAV